MTPAELRIAALQEAGILASGESAAPEDDQLVAAKYASLYEMLLTAGLVSWAVNEDVPDFADVPLTMMLAAVIAPSFGVSGQRLADLRFAGLLNMTPPTIAEKQLRKQLARRYVPHPARAEYY